MFICHKLLKDICGETEAQSGGVRSRTQTPIPSAPYTVPLALGLALSEVPSSIIRAASQLLGSSSPLPDLPQFPCEAAEVWHGILSPQTPSLPPTPGGTKFCAQLWGWGLWSPPTTDCLREVQKNPLHHQAANCPLSPLHICAVRTASPPPG